MWQRLVLSTLLVAATALVYSQVWQFEYVILDDSLYTTQNPRIRQGLTADNLGWCVREAHASNWIPLTLLSLMLDAELYGDWPGGFHLTNVFLHAANVVVLFLLMVRMTACSTRSALVAALFAIHPLHVESVAWVAERKDVLSTLCGLLAIWSYVSFVRRGRPVHLIVSALWFLGSLMAKPTLVTLPFVLLLLDVWPLGRTTIWRGARGGARNNDAGRTGDVAERPSRGGTWDAASPVRWTRLVVEKGPFWGIAVVFCAIAVSAQHQSGAVSSLEQVSLRGRCLNAIVVYVRYMQQALFPQDLAVYYPHPGDSLAVADVLAPAALLLLITVAAVVTARRWPFLLAGWFWYLGTLVPLIGLVQIGTQQMADRYTYVPLIGLSFAVVWLISTITPEGLLRRYVVPAFSAAFLAVLMVAAFLQVSYWRNSITLFRHALAITRDSPLSCGALGTALIQQQQFAEGILYLERALRMAPGDARAHYNLACGLQAAGRLQEAEEHYRIALLKDEANANARNNLGVILRDAGQDSEALHLFSEALEINPEYVDAHINLGVSAAKVGQQELAIAHFERALRLDPSSSIARHNLGLAFHAQQRYEAAILTYRDALRRSPDDWNTRLELARVLALWGDRDAARTEYKQLLTHMPASAVVRNELAQLGLP
jgi:tetratricopeptide (TPR) repeat protein